MSKIGALLRRTFGIVKQHMGTDTFGNKYYYIPEQKTWTGRTIRAKRLVEPVNAKEYEYQEGSIPSEWDAWIRGRRKIPPTIEELLKNERYREQIKFRAKEVEEKEMLIQANEYEEGLVARPAQTQIKGHASAPHYREEQLSAEPSSTANTFQPGSWTPPKDQSTKA
ncbi:NADH dehydrogenase [ubiquinone] 1 alpha subcomplex assembly factor 2-like [Acipenser ruthenus]|uniref:NADH dehydrogenase [ubiquinone] 1 alpha subcomplex assembly factor 2-like n=1 Tax=Acipenser ruthenus TaxID=7906 RepID=UPI00145A16EE|nr:NADH dehydrogenase [ubiquinone] 1 alpha subcomplex assembly factor 2-like [Acipenser ruthenus]